MTSPEPKPSAGRTAATFLLTQLGTFAAQRFAERVAALDLTPPQAGLLRAIAAGPGRSQQALAKHLGTPAPRLVALVDGLEQRGLVQRRRNPEDRRLYAVHLSDEGERMLGELARVAREHDDAMLAVLTSAERDELRGLLGAVADAAGLTPGVHPGYRTLGPPSSPDEPCP